MIQLLQIYIEGFGSIIDPITLPLNTQGIIRVSGANGNGKTTLFSALTWGLYGKSLKGKTDVNTWEEYRPKSYHGTKVVVTWLSSKGVCKVIRCSNYTSKIEDDAKGGNRLLLFIEGNISDIKGKIPLQNEIDSLLGLSYDLFINSIMFGQGMKRLIQESNADKKKLFEEIFKLDYLNVAKTIATNERNNLNSLYKDNLQDKNNIEEKMYSYLKAKEELNHQREEFDQIIHKERNSILKDISSLKSQLDTLKRKVNPHTVLEYNKLRKKVKGLQADLKKTHSVNNIPLIKLVEEVLSLLTTGNVNKAVSKLKGIHKAFKKSQELQSDIYSLNDKIFDLEAEMANQNKYQGEIKRITQSLDKYNQKLKELKNRKLPSVPSHFSDYNINKLKLKLISLEKRNEELSKQLENYNWVLNDPLSNNGIKTFLFDSCLDRLNECLDRYSDTLGFRIEFNVDLDSARKDFVTLIERDGVIIDYDELSGGEKALVNLTMCFALHETITLSKGINILLLDEVFENLDRDNTELVISLIRQLGEGKTIFLISHLENLPFGNCKNLVVSKEGGGTHYKGI